MICKVRDCNIKFQKIVKIFCLAKNKLIANRKNEIDIIYAAPKLARNAKLLKHWIGKQEKWNIVQFANMRLK